MTNHQIEKFNKAKAKEKEILEEGSEKQQSKGYLPVYLKKIEDEKDTPENMIKELIEINLDPEDSDKNVLVGARLMKEEKERIIECLRRNKDIFSWSTQTYQEQTPKKLNTV